ncbi:MAG: cyanophycinase [Bacteroidota bacterium]
MRQIPRGKLILIGGAEDKGLDGVLTIQRQNKQFVHFEILKELLPVKKKGKIILEVITTASEEPDAVVETYKQAFKGIGFNHIGFMNMGNNPDARNPIFIGRIMKAHAILFAGGDQLRISTILGNTDVIDVIMARYYEDPDFIVAGTSAGAMAASTLMIYEGLNYEALLKDSVKTSSGLGFIDNCIIDTHFIKRGRFGRLSEALLMNPGYIGIGLGEDTALIIKKGNEAECRGSGMVVIMDGRDITHSNIAYAEPGTPLCIENMRIHILAKGNGFLLNERKFLASKKDLKREKENSSKLHKIRPGKIKPDKLSPDNNKGVKVKATRVRRK